MSDTEDGDKKPGPEEGGQDDADREEVNPESAGAGEQGEESASEPAAEPEAETAEAQAEPPVAEDAAAKVDGLPKLKISSELEKALAEAEEAIAEKKPRADKKKEFDINEVEEAGEEKPAPPTPREMELKMEILDLRRQVRDLEQEVGKKVKELKQNLDQARHIQSQMDGYKARVQKEKADWFNYGFEPVIKELLPVIDNLELALQHAGEGEEVKGLKEGVALTLRQFLGVLDKFGVKPLAPQGQPFDPEFHQAMSQTEDNSLASNTVVHVHQKGYLMKDRLIRPAMVVVSKRTQPEEAGTGPTPGSGEGGEGPRPPPEAEEGRGGSEGGGDEGGEE